MSSWMTGVFILLVALGFAGAGVIYSRGRVGSLESYIAARGTIGVSATAATLVASGMGAWIHFSPAEAATRGGLPSLATLWARRLLCSPLFLWASVSGG